MAWQPIRKGSVRRAAARPSNKPPMMHRGIGTLNAAGIGQPRHPLVDRPRWSRIELAIGVTVGRPPCRWVAAVEIAAALPCGVYRAKVDHLGLDVLGFGRMDKYHPPPGSGA